ncbi:MAG: DNA topoisomerase 3 [Firmicutes bacterium]|nr:DNA topoisomerase 3 [Bacillota bacterium]MCM1402003.1 DNA topoisomerase 3 [Bacteroides sp.]MCM1476892.1 DNA topoisomerase 3 [Bacteroides sp.]
MKVCITEKPSVAKDIAALLGAREQHKGFFEGNGYAVTWTYGHLCTLKEPADYTDLWRRWSLGSLPMIPERFGIKLIDDAGIRAQFAVIESLVKNATEVINCGDAGQEGELIQRWVMQKARVGCPVKRLWISSLTDESIREGFKNLVPQSNYDNLYFAGLSRAIGDWLLGLNSTRLFSIKYGQGGNVLSIGRVQTPTLALVVKRQLEIENFRPEDYWEIKTDYRDVTFNSTAGRYKSQEQAHQVLEAISGLPLTITDVQNKKGRESAPKLFDLTSLQVECNKKWGWTADGTLKLIQSLYEKKVTTYPRVDTTFLPDDVYPKVPSILRRMTPYAALTAPLLEKSLPKSKRVFDNSKVTDHHAIIPTGESPTTLSGDEKKLYHLIARRFIAAFYPDCEFNTTTVLAEVDKYQFKATGRTIVKPGWRAIYASDKHKDTDENGNDKEAETIMPEFNTGESGPHKPSLLKKATTPPKFYTEGTLLRAMESAGNSIDDEELRDAMKENGIGRPSTRAGIIETLHRRRYIYRDKKSIKATRAGIDLIGLISVDLLKSAKLTGIWENKLRRIERGEYDSRAFIAELKEMIGKIVIDVLSDNSMRKIVTEGTPEPSGRSKSGEAKSPNNNAEEKPRKPRAKAIKTLEQISCPECGRGHLIKGRTAYGCSRYKEGCPLRLPFADYPAELTPAKLNIKLKKSYAK